MSLNMNRPIKIIQIRNLPALAMAMGRCIDKDYVDLMA